MQLGKKEIIKLIQNGHESNTKLITPSNCNTNTSSSTTKKFHSRLMSYNNNLVEDKSFNTFQPIQSKKKSLCMGEYFSFKNDGESSIKLDCLASEENEKTTLNSKNNLNQVNRDNGVKEISCDIGITDISSIESSNNKIINSLIQKLKDYKSQFNEVKNENNKLQELISKNNLNQKAGKLKTIKNEKIKNITLDDLSPNKIQNITTVSTVRKNPKKVELSNQMTSLDTKNNLSVNKSCNLQSQSINFIKSRLFDYDVLNKSNSKANHLSRNKENSHNDSRINMKEIKNLGNKQFKTLENNSTYKSKIRKSLETVALNTKETFETKKTTSQISNNLKLHKLTSFNSENSFLNDVNYKNKKSLSLTPNKNSCINSNSKKSQLLCEAKDKAREKSTKNNKNIFKYSNLNVYKSISLSNNLLTYSKGIINNSNRVQKSLNFDKIHDDSIKLPLTKKHNQILIHSNKSIASNIINKNIKYEEMVNQEEFEFKSSIELRNKNLLKSNLTNNTQITSFNNFSNNNSNKINNRCISKVSCDYNSSNNNRLKSNINYSNEIQVYTKKLCNSKMNFK
jgi:hypothetical protein